MSNRVDKTLLTHIPEIFKKGLKAGKIKTIDAFVEEELEAMGYSEQDLLDNQLDIQEAIQSELIKVAKQKMSHEI